MKNLTKILTFIVMFLATSASACDACKSQQPEITKDLTHGAGPESDWDWFIVGIVIMITVVAFIYSIKYLIKPGEKDKRHVKYSFLQ
ncbi:hypothetical protein QFZ37_003470 [Chryseobacterium ginsenosidimutans]|uniref:hypothetical protein n=1 Tax=Chryseobacterium ginsenosidimutans TaxID=687846 RepID=UPI002786FE13|nr:hypothetical protein [Chryseobacterium ginsenosidimutans]MDQ0595101.1 hypothetical protein [Chryseobacterium ginsenosidimutans]